MFNVGTGELLVILLIALIVLGPEKLPDTARKIGNVVGELRRMSDGFQSEMRAAMDDVTRMPVEPVKDNAPVTNVEPVNEAPVADDAPQSKPDDPAA